MNFTASEELKKNLDRAKELCGHGTSVAAMFEQAMALLASSPQLRK